MPNMGKSFKEIVEENKIIFITSDLADNTVSQIITDLMRWSSDNEKQTIQIYLSSECYDFTNAVAIYDVLSNIPNPKVIYCIGAVGGLSLMYLALADKKDRFALKHTMFSFNQPEGMIGSGANQQTEMDIEARKTSQIRKEFEEILAGAFNKSLEEIHSLCEEEKEFTAEEAKDFGLIGSILR